MRITCKTLFAETFLLHGAGSHQRLYLGAALLAYPVR